MSADSGSGGSAWRYEKYTQVLVFVEGLNRCLQVTDR
jgi:hypothetical protein